MVYFLGPFSLERTGGKKPFKNPQQTSNQNLGVSRPKSTLQGSGLGILWDFANEGLPQDVFPSSVKTENKASNGRKLNEKKRT